MAATAVSGSWLGPVLLVAVIACALSLLPLFDRAVNLKVGTYDSASAVVVINDSAYVSRVAFIRHKGVHLASDTSVVGDYYFIDFDRRSVAEVAGVAATD